LADAAAALVEAGIRFFETLAAPANGASDGAAVNPIQRWLSGAVQTDPNTNRSTLSIPLPASINSERLGGALAGLLAALSGPR
jgi:hypothetical protein